MSMTVEGDDLKDVQRQVWSRENQHWIEIDALSIYYGRGNKLGFRLKYHRPGEATSQEFPSADAALKKLRELLFEREAVTMKDIAKDKARDKAAKKSQLDEARKALRIAEKAYRSV